MDSRDGCKNGVVLLNNQYSRNNQKDYYYSKKYKILFFCPGFKK